MGAGGDCVTPKNIINLTILECKSFKIFWQMKIKQHNKSNHIGM